MTKEEEFELARLYFQAVGMGLSAVMTSLVIEHVRTKGSDPEATMIETRALLNESLSSYTAKGTAQDGSPIDISPEIRRRVSLILDSVEGDARAALGLSPPVKERH